MIIVKSDKMFEGNKLTCIKQFGTLFRPKSRYRIINDNTITVVDDSAKSTHNLKFQLDRDKKPNIFEYFKIW